MKFWNTFSRFWIPTQLKLPLLFVNGGRKLWSNPLCGYGPRLKWHSQASGGMGVWGSECPKNETSTRSERDFSPKNVNFLSKSRVFGEKNLTWLIKVKKKTENVVETDPQLFYSGWHFKSRPTLQVWPPLLQSTYLRLRFQGHSRVSLPQPFKDLRQSV